MTDANKTTQLQIRVSALQKDQIKRQADRVQMSMSEWVLSRLLPSPQVTFQALAEDLVAAPNPSYAFAEMLEFLDALNIGDFQRAVTEAPRADLDIYWKNYLAATIEHTAALKRSKTPEWTREIAPLEWPVFGSSLRSLR